MYKFYSEYLRHIDKPMVISFEIPGLSLMTSATVGVCGVQFSEDKKIVYISTENGSELTIDTTTIKGIEFIGYDEYGTEYEIRSDNFKAYISIADN